MFPVDAANREPLVQRQPVADSVDRANVQPDANAFSLADRIGQPRIHVIA